MATNFKKGFSGDYGVQLSLGELYSWCSTVALFWGWVAFRWNLKYGHCSTSTISSYRRPRLRGQFPYIDQWLEIAQLRQSWVRFCITVQGRCKVLVAQSSKKTPHTKRKSHRFSKGKQRIHSFPHHPMCRWLPHQREEVHGCHTAHLLLFHPLLKFLRPLCPHNQVLIGTNE